MKTLILMSLFLGTSAFAQEFQSAHCISPNGYLGGYSVHVQVLDSSARKVTITYERTKGPDGDGLMIPTQTVTGTLDNAGRGGVLIYAFPQGRLTLETNSGSGIINLADDSSNLECDYF